MCLVCVAFMSAGCAAQEVNVGTLLAEMPDLESMAEFPSPAYTCSQASSYHRNSHKIEDKTYGGWFANHDLGHYIRKEENDGRKEYVLMDAKGPGAIVRIWSAAPTGTLRFYLDGSTKPLELKMADLLLGKVGPITEPFAGKRAAGCNLYFPIPYAKHCKVTGDNDALFYHINYRTYEPGSKVATFTMADLETYKAEIATVGEKLFSPRAVTQLSDKSNSPDVNVIINSTNTIPKGGAVVLGEIKGPAAIRRIVAKVVEARDVETSLRRTVLRITFDGKLTVETPLGDFFGTAPGINPYEGLPMGMTKDGKMWSHWVMPFAKTAKVELVNMGPQPVKVVSIIKASPYKWTDRTMLFHAKWRTEINVPTRPFSDWNYLTATGKGVFAGASYQIYNPVPIWWGEGDEKIFVDGEKFPSTFGTGTEDYFGYAWGSGQLFTHAYHSQSRCDGPGSKGLNTLNRWHIIDRIPFQKSFQFDMEVWHWFVCKVNLTATVYYYAFPDTTDTYKPVTKEMVASPLKPNVPKVAGVIEGETMRMVHRPGAVEPQCFGNLSDYGYMRWWGIKKGQKLQLGFKMDKAGKHRVMGRFLNTVEGGIFQLSINGVKAAKTVDLFAPSTAGSDEKDLGVFDLRFGENVITIEMVGDNPQCKKPNVFGLDYIMLKLGK